MGFIYSKAEKPLRFKFIFATFKPLNTFRDVFNIPLNECIDLVVKYISEGNSGLKRSGNELKRLFGFATNKTIFTRINSVLVIAL